MLGVRNFVISAAAVVFGGGAIAAAAPAELGDAALDRATELRLTGAELAERGAVDLATALALVPDVIVLADGRGGSTVDLRGSRGAAIRVVIDGVPVTDPYYGMFDVGTLPISDIAEIRIAPVAASPVDGLGGSGGTIDIRTRDAIGPQLVIARLTADSLPSVGATGSARVALARHLGLRLSGSAVAGGREFTVPAATTSASLGEGRHAVSGAGRLAYRDGDLRITADGSLDDRHYVAPPADSALGSILLVDRDTAARASATAEDRLGALRLEAQAWTHYQNQRGRVFRDPAFADQQAVENFQAVRSGARGQASGPLGDLVRWTGAFTGEFQKVAASNIINQVSRGQATLLDAGGGVQFARGALRADASAGGGAILGVNPKVWPAAKAVVAYAVLRGLELAATGAHTSRPPTLRERFDPNGNEALGPEHTTLAELRATAELPGAVHVELAPYYKRTTQTIGRSQVAVTGGELLNLGATDFWGIDGQLRAAPHPRVEAGVAYEYLRARAAAYSVLAAQDDPISVLPHHRFDAWVDGRPVDWLSGQLRVTYGSASLDNTAVISSRTVISATLTAHLTSQYLATLRLDDLANERPETRLGYHTPGRQVLVVLQAAWD